MEHRITDINATEKRVELLFSPRRWSMRPPTPSSTAHAGETAGFRPGKVPSP